MSDSTLPNNISMMRANVGEAAALLRALSHGDRLLLLCALVEHEMCVSSLQDELGIQQPSLSQQLGVLRRESLVDTRREGKRIYYRVRPGPALAILEVLHAEFCDPDKPASVRLKNTEDELP